MAFCRSCEWVHRVWDYVRIARLAGGGESREIWKLGPICIKRWSRRIASADIRERCRTSRKVLACNSMWYFSPLHLTVAYWVFGTPATHEVCNNLLIEHRSIGDLHPGNVYVEFGRTRILDFAIRSPE
ncbi:MAG: hypothetical protein DCC68_07540 [Planctomycetota bacterium]|nr:MAG: hypothetical protein DCC68_07540 [Planctomycetota bacterium]